MKKILIVVLALVFMASSVYALEGSRVGQVKLTSKTIYSSASENYGHVHVTTSPTSVYRVTFRSNTANAYCQMFDSSTTGQSASTAAWISALALPKSGGAKLVKADISEDTANNTCVVTYDPPLQFDYGVLVGFGGENANGSVATIEYRQD